MRLAVAAGFAAAALVACGGGGPSKDDFVASADAACGGGNGALAAIAAPTNLPELATAAGVVATTVDRQAEALRSLDAPGDDKGVVAGVVTAVADMAAPARALEAAAGGTDDAATARAANDLNSRGDAAGVQARSYGLAVCGQAPVTNVLNGARTVLKAAFVARAESLCLAAAQARNQGAWDRIEEEEAPLVVAANAKFDAYGLRSCGTLSAF